MQKDSNCVYKTGPHYHWPTTCDVRDEARVLTLAAGLETFSEHPLAYGKSYLKQKKRFGVIPVEKLPKRLKKRSKVKSTRPWEMVKLL